MARSYWWNCHDGSAINLDEIAFISKRNPRHRAGTVGAEVPDSERGDTDYGIAFHSGRVGSSGWLDSYPSQTARDQAYEALMRCLPAAGVKYGTKSER